MSDESDCEKMVENDNYFLSEYFFVGTLNNVCSLFSKKEEKTKSPNLTIEEFLMFV